MKKTFFLLLFCACSLSVFADDPSTNAVQGNRFLFVVENSSTMSRSAKAAQQTVRELIESGVRGEMRAGDNYGIWTFDEQVNMTFPVQQWAPAESKSLALSAEDFLKKHLYKNKGDLKIVLPRIYSFIKASRSVTVILISTGSQPILGTPFDQEMNLIYPQYSRELREAKIPFVTVLIGFHGRPVAYSVNSSLEIKIPQPPLKPEAEATSPTTPQKDSITTNPVPVLNKTIAAKIAPQPEPKKAEVVVPVISTNLSTPIVAPQVALTTAAKIEPIATASKTASTTAVKTADVPKAIETKPVLSSNAVPAEISQSSSATNSSEPPSLIPTHTPESAVTNPSEPKLAPTATLPVAATQPMFSPKKLIFAGAALLVIAAILVVLLLRDSGKSRPSLISDSLDRKK